MSPVLRVIRAVHCASIFMCVCVCVRARARARGHTHIHTHIYFAKRILYTARGSATRGKMFRHRYQIIMANPHRLQPLARLGSRVNAYILHPFVFSSNNVWWIIMDHLPLVFIRPAEWLRRGTRWNFTPAERARARACERGRERERERETGKEITRGKCTRTDFRVTIFLPPARRNNITVPNAKIQG